MLVTKDQDLYFLQTFSSKIRHYFGFDVGEHNVSLGIIKCITKHSLLNNCYKSNEADTIRKNQDIIIDIITKS